eukprot:4843878-Prymnesium_polylepis.4
MASTIVRTQLAECIVWVDQQRDCVPQEWERAAVSDAVGFANVSWRVPWAPHPDSTELLLAPGCTDVHTNQSYN